MAIGKGQEAKYGVADGVLLVDQYLKHSSSCTRYVNARVSLKIEFDWRTFNFGKFSIVFKMSRVMQTSK